MAEEFSGMRASFAGTGRRPRPRDDLIHAVVKRRRSELPYIGKIKCQRGYTARGKAAWLVSQAPNA